MQLKAIVQKGGDVTDLCLTFSASSSAFGTTKVRGPRPFQWLIGYSRFTTGNPFLRTNYLELV
ncbi:unnamed protein product [Laminaria digitata]